MPMKADLWFPTVIWNDHLKDVNNIELKDYVEKLAEEDKEGKVASNYGGWQSKSFEILDQKPIAIERFMHSLQRCINECTKMAGMPDLIISDYWWNINYHKDYNQPHNHRDSMLSGVYYIDVPEDSDSKIHFDREDEAQYYLPRLMPQRNQITAVRATYTPLNNNVLIFPSWVIHYVDGNKSQKPRISMSFNTSIAATEANNELAKMNGYPPLTQNE